MLYEDQQSESIFKTMLQVRTKAQLNKGGIANFDPEKIIYSGNITMYTDDYKETSDQILAYTNGIGGFVQYASYQANEDSYYDYTALRLFTDTRTCRSI